MLDYVDHFELKLCEDPCGQMTNHIGAVCMKHERPKCHCGKFMEPKYDPIAKKFTGYTWSCECTPTLTLAIG